MPLVGESGRMIFCHRLARPPRPLQKRHRSCD
jgi:hypothetical protein